MASTFEMTLAGKRYALASPLVREPIPDTSQQWREGAPGYEDRQGSQFYAWDDLSGGLGLDIIDCNNSEDRKRTSYEQYVDTRWPGSIVLGPLVTSAGKPVPTPTTPQYGRFLDIPGATLFACPSGSWKCQVWRNAATSWARVDSMVTNATNAEKGRDWAFPVPDGVDQRIYLGTGGALFSSAIAGTTFAACGSSFPARAIGYDFGEEGLVCQKTKDDGGFYSVTGHPTTPVATEIAYMGGLVGDIVSFYDADGKFVPYVSVYKAPSGDGAGKPLAALYTIDLIEGKVYPVADAPPAVNAPASAETWQNILVWQGWIYIFLGHDLYRYRPGQWESVPPSKETFTILAGEEATTPIITGMAKGRNWLYLAAEPWVFVISPDGAWHGFAYPYMGSTPLVLSDNWTPARLYIIGSDGCTYYIQLPTGSDNPVEDSAYSYALAGSFQLPWFDGRFAETEGPALRISIIGESLSETEYVLVSYRTARSAGFTDLGTINDTVDYLDFGVGGIGLPFKVIQFKFELHRLSTDATLTPIIRRIVFQYLKKPPVRYRYTASIQVAGTKSGLRSMETILGELETAYDATTLRELKYGRVTANVNIVGLNFVEKPATQKTGQRNVYQIQVAMEEPI